MADLDFKKLVDSQRKFFNTNQTKYVEFRREQLLKLQKIVESNRQNIYDAVYKDLKRGEDITNMIEMQSLLGELDYTLEHLDEWSRPEILPDHPIGKPSIHKEPLGQVFIIGAFNFQIVLALRPAISAIAAGNTVIVKTSENAPATSKLLVDMISPNFPKELFKIIEGDGKVAEALLNERFDHIFYTGCPAIAKIVMAAASTNLTPVTLELGGRNAVLVEEDTNLETAAEKIIINKFVNCGQVCLSPDYVLVNKDLVDPLLQQLKSSIEKQYGKDPKLSSKYSRIINEKHFQRLEDYILKVEDKIVYKSANENDKNDLFIGPHIVKVDKAELFNYEETFGPILFVVGVENFDESLEIVNRNEKCLSSYIFTEDQKKIDRFVNETSSGAITVNDMIKHFAIPTLPFGGVGESGMGSYHGKNGFDTFTHKKPVLQTEL